MHRFGDRRGLRRQKEHKPADILIRMSIRSTRRGLSFNFFRRAPFNVVDVRRQAESATTHCKRSACKCICANGFNERKPKGSLLVRVRLLTCRTTAESFLASGHGESLMLILSFNLKVLELRWMKRVLSERISDKIRPGQDALANGRDRSQ